MPDTQIQNVRMAVDIGGTFTDVVLEKYGDRFGTKVLTTHEAPALGFMRGVEQLLRETATPAEAVELIIHGTTLATNAIIERSGARTALVVTEGHRDALEMAYENRFDQYDIDADRPLPLVPRVLRQPVTERIDFRGRVRTPLDEESVRLLVPLLVETEVESVAVGLLHAYANPEHEQRVAEILSEQLPELSISLSSDVCPEIREYERQSTTVANAYIRPLMARYLQDLERRLGNAGMSAPCLLMTSGGSLVTLEIARRHPVRLIESGPAGGAILAAHIAGQLGEERVLSFDMGGTTAKICLIDHGEPLLSRSFEVDRAHRFMKGSGLPVKVPVVEMVEIGAGGGSIARVDTLGRIRVGPKSAGSEPGPACYGRGGKAATVSDANLLLGRLDAESFAGGRLKLERSAAERALRQTIATPLVLDPAEAAASVVEIVDENMAAASRMHAAERGRELAGRTLIAFGGGAPLHAARLAEKLGITRVIVPVNAGVGSAIGFLLAPIAYELVRSRYLRLSEFDPGPVNEAIAAMVAEAKAIVRLGAPNTELVERRHAYARYLGQGHEIKVELACRALEPEDAHTLRERFETEYASQYGRIVPGLDIEVLTWSVIVATRQRDPQPVAAPVETEDTLVPRHTREIRYPGGGAPLFSALYSRADIRAGQRIVGPAALEEMQTTTLVPPGFEASLNGGGDLLMVRVGETAGVMTSRAIRNQVIWDRFLAIVEEQAQALIRTAFSTTVREAGDLSAGLFDLQGRMLAQAVTGTPGHVNAMAASVGAFLASITAERMREGDVFVTNDPWLGTGHLFDFTVVTPVFCRQRLVALFASTVHVVDIGGPGFGPDAGQIYEEGLCIPILPLFSRGEVNESLLAIVRANVREPVQVVGDLYSLAASNAVGGRRLLELMDEFDLGDLALIGDHIVQVSCDAMLAEIAKIPAGRYQNSMTVDGYAQPVRLEASMSVSESGIEVDFSGSSVVSSSGINVPLTYAQAYASFGIRCVVGSSIPNNAGSLSALRVTAPEGCILNAPRPAAVAVRHVIGQMLPDVVLGCLEQALPGRAPAEGSSSLWNPMLSGGHGMVGDSDYGAATPFSVTIFHSGGTGARPGKDGLSATAFPSGVRNTPVEITESVSPLLFRRKEYRIGSGGDGLFRGGDGQMIEIEHAEKAPFAVFALFDRIQHPARGRGGGGDGAHGAVRLGSGRELKGMGKQIVPPGDLLILELPGGGGLGERSRRRAS